MNSKQIVLSALAGKPTPRVPVGPLAVQYCARVGGYSIRQYTTDAQALADSVIRYYEQFMPDAVWVSSDTWVSAEAMGAKVGANDDHQPFGGVGEPLIQTAADIDRIPAADVGCRGRYPLMLEAVSTVVRELGQDACVVACFDQYPFSLAAALMGINEIMVKLADDPDFVQALMERCLEYGLAYGKALSEAGADMLSGGDSPAGLVSPGFYSKYLLPYERRLIGGLKEATAKPVSLHICGRATPLLQHMKTSGADVLELDHFVGLGAACQAVGPDIALWGNLDPVSVLAQGTPEDVEREALQAMDAITAAGHRRFVLSSGCGLAMETPYANLEALIRIARRATL